MRERPQAMPVIFSDLDGTLLDPRSYSFERARQALRLVKESATPLVLVSSKTRAEIEQWRARLGNDHPFITENGGGVFLPGGYFPGFADGVLRGAYRMLLLGTPYETVRRKFAELRAELGAAVRGFGDMTVGEVQDLTGLSEEDARLSMIRDFDEPFVFQTKTDERFLRAIEDAGLHWTRGRLFHIMGDHDKGRAVVMLRALYERHFGPVETIGIGDAPNDLPLLRAVDRPVLVGGPFGRTDEAAAVQGVMRTAREGPEGWNEAVMQLIGTKTP